MSADAGRRRPHVWRTRQTPPPWPCCGAGPGRGRQPAGRPRQPRRSRPNQERLLAEPAEPLLAAKPPAPEPAPQVGCSVTSAGNLEPALNFDGDIPVVVMEGRAGVIRVQEGDRLGRLRLPRPTAWRALGDPAELAGAFPNGPPLAHDRLACGLVLAGQSVRIGDRSGHLPRRQSRPRVAGSPVIQPACSRNPSGSARRFFARTRLPQWPWCARAWARPD